MMQVKCDECGSMFAPNVIEIDFADKSTQMLFNCPECEKVYVIGTIKPGGKEIRARLQQAMNDVKYLYLNGAPTEQVLQQNNLIDQLREEYKKFLII